MTIKDLRLVITSAELKDLVEARARYHTDRVELLKAEVTRMGELLDDMDEEASLAGKFSNSGSTVNSLKSKLKKHRDQATYFTFFAAHIVPNETYELTQHDLATLEVVEY
jgi:hypothetical protein